MPASSRKSKGRRPGSSTDELQSQAGTAGGRSASSSPKSLRALMSSNQPPPEIQASIALAMRQKQQRQHNNKPPLSGSIWSFASGMHLCAAAYLDEAPAPSSAASTMSSTSDKDANSLSLSASLSSPRSRQSLKGNSVLGKTKSLMLSTAKRGSFSQLSRPSTSSGRVAGDNHATTTTTSKLPAVDKERATPDITRRKSTTSEKHLGSISKTPPPALRHQRSCGFESLRSSQALSIQPRSVGSMSALAVPGEPLITAIKTICIASDWDDKVLALNAELAFMHSQATQTHALSKSSAFYLLVLTSGSDASRQSLPADPSEKRISTLSFLGMHRDQIEANAPVVVRRTWKELELLDAHLHASLEVLLTRPEHTSVTRLATFLESKAKDGLVKPSNVESTRSLRKRLFSPTKRKEDHVEPFALMNTAATTLDSADSGHSSMQRVMAFKRALDDYWQRLFETCGDALATSRAVSDFFALRLGDPVKLSTPPKEMSDHHRISVFDLNAPITSEQKDSNANPENSAHSDIESAKSLRSKLSSSSSSKSLRVMLKPPASPTSLRSIATFGKPSHFDDWRTPRGSWGDGGYYKRVEGKSSSPPQDTTFRPHVSQRRPGTALPHGAQALRNVLEEDNKGVAQKPGLGVPNQLNLARQTERRATEGTLTHVPRSRVLSPSAGRLVRPRTASEAETSSRLHRKDKKGERTSLTSTTDLADAEIRFIGVTNPYARERFGTSFHVIGREPARHVNIDGRPHTAKGLDPAASGWATFEQADSRPRASAVEQRSVSGPASAPSLKTQSDIVELLRTETRSSTSDNKSKEPSAHNTTAGLQLMSATDRIPSVEHSAHVRTHSSMSSTPSVIDALFSAAVQTLSPTVELDAEYREPVSELEAEHASRHSPNPLTLTTSCQDAGPRSSADSIHSCECSPRRSHEDEAVSSSLAVPDHFLLTDPCSYAQRMLRQTRLCNGDLFDENRSSVSISEEHFWLQPQRRKSCAPESATSSAAPRSESLRCSKESAHQRTSLEWREGLTPLSVLAKSPIAASSPGPHPTDESLTAPAFKGKARARRLTLDLSGASSHEALNEVAAEPCTALAGARDSPRKPIVASPLMQVAVERGKIFLPQINTDCKSNEDGQNSSRDRSPWAPGPSASRFSSSPPSSSVHAARTPVSPQSGVQTTSPASTVSRGAQLRKKRSQPLKLENSGWSAPFTEALPASSMLPSSQGRPRSSTQNTRSFEVLPLQDKAQPAGHSSGQVPVMTAVLRSGWMRANTRPLLSAETRLQVPRVSSGAPSPSSSTNTSSAAWSERDSGASHGHGGSLPPPRRSARRPHISSN